MVIAKIFRMQNKPVIFTGQGIGPVNRFSTRFIVKNIVKDASLITLREKISLETVQKLTNVNGNCYVTGDDALLSSDISEPNIALPEKFIALNLRFSSYSFTESGLIKKFAELVQKLMTEYSDHSFVFLPIAHNKGDSDVETARKIVNLISAHHKRILIIEDNLSQDHMRGILKKASFALGGSYHFCLFALSVGTPTIALYANAYYKKKMEGLMDMFVQGKSAFNLSAENSEGLLRHINDLRQNFCWSKTDLTRKRISDNVHRAMSNALDMLKSKKEC